LAYGLNAIEYPYDITKPQPQLFVTPDFEHLKLVLDKFADTMAFRVGGKQSLDKAIDCKAVCTAEYSSGLQVSGVFKLANTDKNLSYIQTQGPTALAVAGKQLEGHGINYHSEGFGSPVGHLRGADRNLADFDETTLIQYGIAEGQQCSLNFASGIIVSGIVRRVVRQLGKIVLISFTGCEVYRSNGGEVYFKPEWGTYDMAVGAEIVSVFAGAADKDAFDVVEEHLDQAPSSIPTETEDVKLINCHAAIRNLRDNGFDQKIWLEIFSQMGPENADHWLGLVELFEIAWTNNGEQLTTQAEQRLLEFITLYPNLKKLINDGLRVAKEEALNNH